MQEPNLFKQMAIKILFLQTTLNSFNYKNYLLKIKFCLPKQKLSSFQYKL